MVEAGYKNQVIHHIINVFLFPPNDPHSLWNLVNVLCYIPAPNRYALRRFRHKHRSKALVHHLTSWHMERKSGGLYVFFVVVVVVVSSWLSARL